MCEKAPQMDIPSSDKGKLKVSRTQSAVTVSGEGVELVFDATDGMLRKYSSGGKNLLAGEGSLLRPNFWRAVTDNDFGAGLQKKLGVWRNPSMELISLEAAPVKAKGKEAATSPKAKVSATYSLPEVKATLTMTYGIYADGSLEVTEEITYTIKRTQEQKKAIVTRNKWVLNHEMPLFSEMRESIEAMFPKGN